MNSINFSFLGFEVSPQPCKHKDRRTHCQACTIQDCFLIYSKKCYLFNRIFKSKIIDIYSMFLTFLLVIFLQCNIFQLNKMMDYNYVLIQNLDSSWHFIGLYLIMIRETLICKYFSKVLFALKLGAKISCDRFFV